MDLTDFYNHKHFLKELKEATIRINKIEEEYRKMPAETTDLKIGNLIETTETATIIAGQIGKIIDIWREGKWLRFVIDFDFSSKKKKHYILTLRKKDVKFYAEK